MPSLDEMLAAQEAELNLLRKHVTPNKPAVTKTQPSAMKYEDLFGESKPKPGFFASNLKKGYGGFAKSVGGLTEALGSATGLEGLQSVGKDAVDYWSQFGKEQEQLRPSTRPTWEAPVSSTAKFIAEQAVQQVPNFVLGIASGGAAWEAALAKGLAAGLTRDQAIKMATRAAGAGAFGTTLGQETGSIYSEQAPEDKSVTRAVGYAIPAAALEIAPYAGLAKRTGLPNLIGGLGGKEIKGGLLKAVGKEAVMQGASEATTEFGQTLLEQQGANKPLDFEEAGLAALAGGGIGGMMGGGAGFASFKSTPPVTDNHTPVDLLQTPQEAAPTEPVMNEPSFYQGTPDLGLSTNPFARNYDPAFGQPISSGIGADIRKVGGLPQTPLLGYNPQPSVIEQPWNPQGNQQGFFFGGDEGQTQVGEGYRPIGQGELDLTGSANPFQVPATRNPVNAADFRNERGQLGDLGSQIEMPTHYGVDNNPEFSPYPSNDEQQLGLDFETPALQALKAKSKGKSTPKQIKPLTAQISQPETQEQEISEPSLEQEVAAHLEYARNGEEYDPTIISNFMGIPLEQVSAVVDSYIKAHGSQDIPKPKGKGTSKKIKKVATPAEALAEIAGTDLGVETSGEEVTARLKAMSSKVGYKKTKFAKDIFDYIKTEGLLPVNVVERLLPKAGVNYFNDLGSRKVSASEKERTYINQTAGFLAKGRLDGILALASKEGTGQYWTLAPNVTSEQAQAWFDGLKDKENRAQGDRDLESVDAPVPVHSEEKVSKADQARIARQEARAKKKAAHGNLPHTILKGRMEAFKTALIELDAAIAKLPAGKAKTALRKEYANAKAKFDKFLGESNGLKLKLRYNELLKANDKEGITALKQEARDIGKLELEDRLASLRVKIGAKDKSPDSMGLERQSEIEGAKAKLEGEAELFGDLSNPSVMSSAEVMEHESELLAVMTPSQKEAYEAIDSVKQSVAYLRQVAKSAYDRIVNPSAKKGLDTKSVNTPVQGPPQALREFEIESARTEKEVKPTGKLVKVKKEKKAGPAFVKGIKAEQDYTYESSTTYKTNVTTEEGSEPVFDNSESHEAHNDYVTFIKYNERVGSSKSIPTAARNYINAISKAFKLSERIFITTASDLKLSKLSELSKTAKELYDENGDYVGIYHSTEDGVAFIALNDDKLSNTLGLINILSHEVGHAIIREHFDNASEDVRLAIVKDYAQWASRLEQGDSNALNELYQESGKDWDTFLKEYSSHIEVNPDKSVVVDDSLFEEYMAEQVAKYIKAEPKTKLSMFFEGVIKSLKKLLGITNFNKTRNQLPIQSIEDWLDSIIKTQEVPKQKLNTSSAKRKSFVEAAKKQVQDIASYSEYFNPAKNGGFVKGIDRFTKEGISNENILKKAYNGLFRLQYWRDDLRPSTIVYGERQENKIQAYLKLLGIPISAGTKNTKIDLRKVAEELNSLKTNDRKMVFDLIILGDKLGVDFNSKKDITSDKYINMSDASFDLYKKVNSFMKQAWGDLKRGYADALTYDILGGRNSEYKFMRSEISQMIMDKNINTIEEIRNHFDKAIKKDKQKDYPLAKWAYDVEKAIAMYKSYTNNYSEGLKGYIPRERLEGAEWKVEAFKGDKKVFSKFFYTKHEAARFAKELETNPMKHIPINYKVGDVITFKEPQQIVESKDYESKADYGKNFKLLEDRLESIMKDTDISKEEQAKIINELKREINNKLLAQMGRQSEINRSKDLIEGFDEDNPIEAINKMLSRSANAFARSKYVFDQLDILHNADRKDKVAISDYIRETMRPPTPMGKHAQKIKNFTAIYFMGFRPLTALMQLTQLATVGAAELGMHTRAMGIKTPAHVLLTKALMDNLNKSNLTKEEADMLDDVRTLGETFEASSQLNMFKTMDDEAVSSILGSRVDKAVDMAMWMFKQAEIKNREAAILASYRLFRQQGMAKDVAQRKALDFNNNTNFMLNRGNVPSMLKGNVLGEVSYSLMSYTMNMLNWMFNRAHGSVTDTQFDKKAQRLALMRLMGFSMMIGGLAGMPLVDDLNKAIRKFFGVDFRHETEQFVKKNMGKDIANLVTDGMFAPAGVNISGNMAIRLPFLSGMLDDKSVLESATGATGALANKVIDAPTELLRGNYYKAAETAAPEFMASGMRAYRMYDKGQRNATGSPVYSEGKPVKPSGIEAIGQAFGVKSQRRAEIMQTADTEYKLTKFWNDKKKNAMKKASEGDMKALQEFNKSLLKDKTARVLVKPITKLSISKPDKVKTAFEQQTLSD